MSGTRVYIALGSNLGDRRANIARALVMLHQDAQTVRVSDLVETAAVGGPADSPPYLNGAAEFFTTLTPQALMDHLLEIEASIGRVRNARWEPRLIDLDILLYGDAVIDTPTLKVPHPLMHTRRFVLEPLAQLAPKAVHPVLHKTIAQLLAELPAES